MRCEGRTTDSYGRLIAVCYVGDTDINAWLVRNGWALAYRRYSKDYVDDEHAAARAGAGLWRGAWCRRGSGAEDGSSMQTCGTAERPEPGIGTVPTSTRKARLSAFSTNSVRATSIAVMAMAMAGPVKAYRKADLNSGPGGRGNGDLDA